MTKIKTKLLFLSLFSLYFSSLVSAQTYPPPTNLISIPSAATLQRGSYSLQMHVQKEGGLTSSISVGLTDRFQLGLSFGSANLIGDDSLIMYPNPETNLKYLLIDETESVPGISIGLNTQGMGKFNSADSLMRYDIKAMGIYAASSKNWVTPLGNMGLHFGTNYNFIETADGDKDLNYFCDEIIKQWGGKPVTDPEINDVLIFQTATNVPNHCGVYLGKDMFFHHAVNRLSCRESLYPMWAKHLVGIYRYEA